MTTLTIDGASKAYGRIVAVRTLSMDIPAATWCVVVGPNGSGKTTLLQLASGLQTPTSGEVRVGHAIAGQPAARAEVSYLNDSPAFFSDLTVSDHIDYLAGLFNDPDVVTRAQEIIHQFDLNERANDIPDTFSRGMKQKTAVALALARPASVLLLDEPTRGLDTDGTATMIQLLRERHRNGATVITVTHEPEQFGTDGLRVHVRDGAFGLEG